MIKTGGLTTGMMFKKLEYKASGAFKLNINIKTLNIFASDKTFREDSFIVQLLLQQSSTFEPLFKNNKIL